MDTLRDTVSSVNKNDLKHKKKKLQFTKQGQQESVSPVNKNDLSEADKVLFNYKVNIQSSKSPIREIAHPENFEILEQ